MPLGLSIRWHGDPPAAALPALRFWHLDALAHEDFTAALEDAFEKRGDPEFALSWSGVAMALSSRYDLAYMADDLIGLGHWLCWPAEPHDFSLTVQGFHMEAVAGLAGTSVDIEAVWKGAYRTPVERLAGHVSIERDAAIRAVGGLLGQLEQMLYLENRVYMPLSFVCRYLAAG
ncbi:MAG: hypothetical protein V4574_20620 [Pseudomonadota bacterium]